MPWLDEAKDLIVLWLAEDFNESLLAEYAIGSWLDVSDWLETVRSLLRLACWFRSRVTVGGHLVRWRGESKGSRRGAGGCWAPATEEAGPGACAAEEVEEGEGAPPTEMADEVDKRWRVSWWYTGSVLIALLEQVTPQELRIVDPRWRDEREHARIQWFIRVFRECEKGVYGYLVLLKCFSFLSIYTIYDNHPGFFFSFPKSRKKDVNWRSGGKWESGFEHCTALCWFQSDPFLTRFRRRKMERKSEGDMKRTYSS